MNDGIRTLDFIRNLPSFHCIWLPKRSVQSYIVDINGVLR